MNGVESGGVRRGDVKSNMDLAKCNKCLQCTKHGLITPTPFINPHHSDVRSINIIIPIVGGKAERGMIT